MMDTLEDLDPSIPVAVACDALGASRATLYRGTAPPRPPVPRVAPPVRRLSDEERALLIKVLHSPEFADQPPAEVYAKLLSAGQFIASIRTMYRVLSSLNESKERRRGHHATHHPKPMLTAMAPNEVWTWDITKVPGPERGTFFYIYVILDLFSRYVVGWLAAAHENARHATRLIGETVARHGVEPGALTLHSDRGSPMKAGSMAQLLANLEIEQSFSRPRVSDDNPFVESHFKTMKYQPDFPDKFGSLLHVRGFCQELFAWYNQEHHHAGIALFTPADVFEGRVAVVAATRQAALDAAYAAHPERFVHGPPTVPLPPKSVSINPPPPPDEAAPSEPPLRSSEPPSETSVRPSPANASGARAQSGSRAAQSAEPARAASEPLTRSSTSARLRRRGEPTSKPTSNTS